MTLRSIINLSASLLLVLNLVLLLVPAALCASIDAWNAVMVEGSAHKFDRRYELAAQSFAKAVSLAEKEKLPPKCLPLSLCHLADIELIMNRVSDDDSNFKRLIVLLKSQKECKTLDEELRSKADFLADQYQKNQKPELRELCLKRSCYLKTLLHGNSNQQCTDCLSLLANCYIDEDKVDQAIKILAMIEALKPKQSSKASDRLGNTLNDLAIKCETERKYEQATGLELAAIKIAKSSHSNLRTGLPSFYSLIDMTALSQGKKSESKQYFCSAIQECSKLKTQKEKVLACQYLNSLADAIWANRKSKLVPMATAFKHMLAVSQAITWDRNWQFQFLSRLAAALDDDKGIEKDIDKQREQYLRRAIAIVELPTSHNKQELPDLYMRLAMCQLCGHNTKEANKNFNKALALEEDKNGFHAARTFYFWGCVLGRIGQPGLAAEKFNMAFQRVCALPPEKRGTLLADLLRMLAQERARQGRHKDAQILLKQTSDEMQLQKTLNTNLGPEFF